MKILFLMLQLAEEKAGGGMYVDLAKQFKDGGHDVTIMAPDNEHAKTYLREEHGMRVLRVNSKATQGVSSMVKKGLALATLQHYYKKAYNKHLKGESFDWIIMPTPPITLSGFVGYVKMKTGAKFSLVKVIMDVSLVGITVVLALLFFGLLTGNGHTMVVREGTLIQAVLTGLCMHVTDPLIDKTFKRL